MEFTLVYRGPLKANGKPADKQKIRREFHSQIRELWKQPPLKGWYLGDNPPSKGPSIIQNLGGFRLAPLVTKKLDLIAELQITLLRPELPGGLVTQGGDIDNRLKTLLDALRMPRNMGEIPLGQTPTEDEDPFFCLLEDDSLITKIGVCTDRLLEKTTSRSEVLLLVHARTKVTKLSYNNLGLG